VKLTINKAASIAKQYLKYPKRLQNFTERCILYGG